MTINFYLMRIKLFYLSFLLIAALTFPVSCQKQIDGTIVGGGGVVPANQFPKVGTIWTYRYNWWNSAGGATNTKLIYHKAKSEETIAGEKWLKIVDVETDTTVYFLNTKIDGLYQYTNNASYMLCKYPATVGDTYNTFNGGSAEDFTVRAINDTTPTGIGNIPLSKYEGVKGGIIIDVVWYNKNAWIVWKYQYKKFGLAMFPIYHILNQMHIDNIVY
jgi:hypothetical protein